MDWIANEKLHVKGVIKASCDHGVHDHHARIPSHHLAATTVPDGRSKLEVSASKTGCGHGEVARRHGDIGSWLARWTDRRGRDSQETRSAKLAGLAQGRLSDSFAFGARTHAPEAAR